MLRAKSSVDWRGADDWVQPGEHPHKHGVVMHDRSGYMLTHRGRCLEVMVEDGQVRIRSRFASGYVDEIVLPVPKGVSNG